MERSGSWLAVDKPAQCGSVDSSCWNGSPSSATDGVDSLSVRLKSAGLGDWSDGDLGGGISGATWLRPAGEAGRSSHREGGVERKVVLGIADYDGPVHGILSSHSFRVRGQFQGRALLDVTSRACAEKVGADFARAGHVAVGLRTSQSDACPASSRPLIHVLSLVSDNLPVLAAPLPVEFNAWLNATAMRPASQFEAALLDVGVYRWKLSYERQALRLLSEGSGEISGFTVDRYGDFSVIAVSTRAAAEHVTPLAQFLMECGARGVYVKYRARMDLRQLKAEELSPGQPLCGAKAPDTMALQMGSLQLQVRLGQGHSTGLFLDQADNWPLMAGFARQGSLLNLFCYTGAFTVFAARQGAKSTVSVDLSASALRILRANLDLNELSGPRHRVLKSDAISWLERAGRRREQYDAIVLDPPSFGTRSKGVLSLQRDYESLLERTLKLLAVKGQLLSVVHLRALSWTELRERIMQVASRLGQKVVVRGLPGGGDCPTVIGVSETKNFLITRLE